MNNTGQEIIIAVLFLRNTRSIMSFFRSYDRE